MLRAGTGPRTGDTMTGDPGAPIEPESMSHRQILESLSGLLLVLFVAMISSTIVSPAPGRSRASASAACRHWSRSSSRR